MSSPHAFTPRPCVIIALELLGLEDSDAPIARLRKGVEVVGLRLGRESAEMSRLFMCGARAIRIAELNPGATPLFSQLLSIAMVQIELAFEDILVRGAVTIGDAAASNDFIAGDGLSVAERLRDELADVPRIIIDPRLLRELESNPALRAAHQSVPMSLDYLRQILHEDVDGLWAVDYLKFMVGSAEDLGEHIWFLRQHRALIERKLSTSTALDRTSRGFTWLRSYHNRVIEEQFEWKRFDEAERSLLRIPATSPLVYAFPPSALKP